MSPTKFVRTWVEAYDQDRSAKWVANKLGMTRTQVFSKAYNMRKKGVRLPTLTKSTEEFDVDKLNSLIAGRS